MNELISALIIAVVQGFTEWLPVSSSGHLVLVERLLDYRGGLLFDVALHFGTLASVFVYFGGDIVDIIKDLLNRKWDSENGRLGLLIIAATIPAVIVGFLLRNVFEFAFGSLGLTALGFGITGLFLIIASLDFTAWRGSFGFVKSLLVGAAQTLALFPGISRSGATISSGLLLGLDEKNAMKFSFLMSVPIVFGANILVVGNNTLPKELIWATLVSFVVGLLVLHLLYRWVLVNRKNLRWFGAYALLLGLVIGGYLVLVK